MAKYYTISTKRATDYQADRGRYYDGDRYDGAVIANGSKNLPGHKKRMKRHTRRVHKAIGPYSGCYCDICDDYRELKTYGRYHETHACRCPGCQVRRAKAKAARELAKVAKMALLAAQPKKKRDRKAYLREYHRLTREAKKH